MATQRGGWRVHVGHAFAVQWCLIQHDGSHMTLTYSLAQANTDAPNLMTSC